MCHLQLEDLNRGTFGFVQLAYDRVSRQQVAIKFIERGDKVSTRAAVSNTHTSIKLACSRTAEHGAACGSIRVSHAQPATA